MQHVLHGSRSRRLRAEHRAEEPAPNWMVVVLQQALAFRPGAYQDPQTIFTVVLPDV